MTEYIAAAVPVMLASPNMWRSSCNALGVAAVSGKLVSQFIHFLRYASGNSWSLIYFTYLFIFSLMLIITEQILLTIKNSNKMSTPELKNLLNINNFIYKT